MSEAGPMENLPKTKMNHLNIDELVGDPYLAGERIIEELSLSGALFVNFPGYGEIHASSMSLAQEFFSLSSEIKQHSLGTNFFRKRLQGSVSIEFLGHSYTRLAAELYGRERGWVPTGFCNTGANKEYFQFGIEHGGLDFTGQGLIPNIWPIGDFGVRYKEVKLAHLEIFCSIHKAIFVALSTYFCNERLDQFHTWPANVMCRDTHYLAQDLQCLTEPTVVRNPSHVDLGEGTLVRVEPGLQIYTGRCKSPIQIAAADEWAFVEQGGADSLLYIPGLALEIRSGGLVKAAWHRVIGNLSEVTLPRYSIVSFGNAGIDDMLAPIPNMKGWRQIDRYLPIRRDHLPIIGNKTYVEAIW